MRIRFALALLVAGLLIGGCKMLPKIEPPSLGISNGTKLPAGVTPATAIPEGLLAGG